MKKIFTLLVVLMAFLGVSCKGSNLFSPIGDNMANPITLAVDSDRSRLYINNSDFRVSYNDGSLHVVNIADVTSPTRIDYVESPSFSGEFYLDTTGQLLYTPNRYSTSDSDIADNLFRFDINEASADFLGRSDYVSGDDPYGITCCDAENRMLVASEVGQMDYYDMDDSLAYGSLSLTSTLSTDEVLTGEGATRVVIFGTQAIVTRSAGGLWIINLEELGVDGTYPIDYYVSDVYEPRGIAIDSRGIVDKNYIYVASVEKIDDVETPMLLVLDLAATPPVTDNTKTEIVSKSTMLIASPNLGHPNPSEILIVTDVNRAYVTDFDDNLVSVVELTGFTKTTEFNVGQEPYGMAAYSSGGTGTPVTHICVANAYSDTVSIVDISNNAIVGTYP